MYVSSKRPGEIFWYPSSRSPIRVIEAAPFLSKDWFLGAPLEGLYNSSVSRLIIYMFQSVFSRKCKSAWLIQWLFGFLFSRMRLSSPRINPVLRHIQNFSRKVSCLSVEDQILEICNAPKGPPCDAFRKSEAKNFRQKLFCYSFSTYQ